MNRKLKRMLERGKPSPPSRRPVRIPKIVLQDRDFNQIEIMMMRLAKGEIDFENGRYVMTALDGEKYCIVNALEGWIENFARLAKTAGVEYDDTPLVLLKNRLKNGMMLTPEGVSAAKAVVDAQIKIYQAAPKEMISSVATTTQISLMLQR